jgi:hypothetical protein
VAAWVLKKMGEYFRRETGMGGEGEDNLDPEAWLAELEEEKKKGFGIRKRTGSLDWGGRGTDTDAYEWFMGIGGCECEAYRGPRAFQRC